MISITTSTWDYLQRQWNSPFGVTNLDKKIFPLNLMGLGVECLCKIMVAVAALIAIVATPVLLCVNCCKIPFLKRKTMSTISILEFYRGGRNDKGVTLEEIWKWDNIRLEAQHDFIQWLFPIEKRGVNPTASLSNKETQEAFKRDKILQQKMLKSLERMLHFYGFTRKSNGKILISSTFNVQSKNWLNRSNHNYLRISRILESLRLHGLESDAKAFFSILEQVYKEHSDKIGSTTFDYWRSAEH